MQNFNPHSREGSDDKTNKFNAAEAISIHTPAKGVTRRPEMGGKS